MLEEFSAMEGEFEAEIKEQAIDVIVFANPRRAAKEYQDKIADYFIVSDVKSGKACCISSDKLYNFKDTGAVYTASCDPDPSDFFLTGYNTLKESRDYFEAAILTSGGDILYNILMTN